jgi:hypothetical protein
MKRTVLGLIGLIGLAAAVPTTGSRIALLMAEPKPQSRTPSAGATAPRH